MDFSVIYGERGLSLVWDVQVPNTNVNIVTVLQMLKTD